jgi:cobalt-precorrin 5A hydrolase
MVGDKAMIAIGIGCRRGAATEAIVAIVGEAVKQARLPDEPAHLFSIEHKRDEAGLAAAAAELGLPLDFLSPEALRAVEDRIATRSAHAKAALGVASVSEAAALAGGGADARLILPRIVRDGVACAIAQGRGL